MDKMAPWPVFFTIYSCYPASRTPTVPSVTSLHTSTTDAILFSETSSWHDYLSSWQSLWNVRDKLGCRQADRQLCHTPIQPDKRNLFQLLCLSVCLSVCVKSDVVRTQNTYAAILVPSARFKRLYDKWENVRDLMSNAACLRQDRLTVCLMLVRLHKMYACIKYLILVRLHQIAIGVQFNSISYEDGVAQRTIECLWCENVL
jgi:hypothetical protein